MTRDTGKTRDKIDTMRLTHLFKDDGLDEFQCVFLPGEDGGTFHESVERNLAQTLALLHQLLQVFGGNTRQDPLTRHHRLQYLPRQGLDKLHIL